MTNGVIYNDRKDGVFLVLVDCTWIRNCFNLLQYGHALACIETRHFIITMSSLDYSAIYSTVDDGVYETSITYLDTRNIRLSSATKIAQLLPVH